MSRTKTRSAEPIGSENSLLLKGSYEWQCTHDSWRSHNEIRSPNFYPGSFNTAWNIVFDLRKDGRETQIKVGFHVINAVEVPVRFVFTILKNPFTLTVSKKGSKRYEIADFSREELIFGCFLIATPRGMRTKWETVYVRWSMEAFFSTRDLPGALMQNLASLLNCGKFSDCVIVTEDGSHIPVHRSILSTRSPVFCSMLDTDKLKRETRCVKIPDFPTQTVKDMLMFMYTSRLPKFSEKCATELLKIAYRYDLEDLKGVCSDNLSSHLTAANVMKVLLLADEYREGSLKRKALDFISKNRAAFANPSKFDSLMKQRPNLLMEVISRIAKS